MNSRKDVWHGSKYKNDETERRIRELARRRGLGVTSAIRLAVENELAKDEPPKRDSEKIIAAVRKIQDQVAKLPVLMSDEEIDAWMYDENGLPH
ncbi:MAG: type II toxin-antitoxin system VapB family antitoxin [Sphingorhabdus sp.]